MTQIVVAGDPGTGDAHEAATVDGISARAEGSPYDALLLLGDLVYEDGEPDRLDAALLAPFAPVIQTGLTVIPVLGNHDYRSGRQMEILARLGRSSSWYAQQVGDVRVVVLDTEQVDNPAQTRWLETTLADKQGAEVWTVVAMHRPPYSAGKHGSSLDVRRAWSPLFERYDVPLVLAGHDHDYQRSIPQAGVTYLVSGAAAKLRPTGSEPFTAVSTSTRHFVELVAEVDRLDVRAIDQDGKVLDAVTLSR
ncbi:MAG: metallophosphoesterase [Ornithinimicrobium sp.]